MITLRLTILLLMVSVDGLEFGSLVVHLQDPDPVGHGHRLVHEFGRLQSDRLVEVT